jgi:hypothetical protein
MDMLPRQHAGDDLDAEFLATCRIIVRIRSRAFQHRVAILRDPDDGLAMVKNRVTPASVAHKPTP